MWDQQTLLAPDGWLGNAILGTAESSGSYSVYPSMRIGISVSCGKEFGFPLRSFAAFALNALDAGHRPAIPSSLPFPVFSVAKRLILQCEGWGQPAHQVAERASSHVTSHFCRAAADNN
jgi:hypothetical protein